MKRIVRFTARMLIAVSLAAAGHAASAETGAYPGKPVKIIVPYSPGGPIDTLARTMGAKLGEIWGQQVIVENKPGANEIIASSYVSKSSPDGYTLMLSSDAALSLNQFLYKKLTYDPVKDLAPITRVALSNMAFVIPAAMPVSSLKEFVAYARANPSKVTYGTSGVGGPTHLPMAWFAKEQKLEIAHVPYKGLSPVLQDMLGNNVQATLGAVSVVKPFVENGKLKVLAVSGDKRATSLPGVPTFAEAGYPGFEAVFRFDLSAPAGIDAGLKNKIYSDVKRVVSDPKFRKDNLDNFALEPVLDTPEEFEKFLVKDRDAARKKIQISGAQLD